MDMLDRKIKKIKLEKKENKKERMWKAMRERGKDTNSFTYGLKILFWIFILIKYYNYIY